MPCEDLSSYQPWMHRFDSDFRAFMRFTNSCTVCPSVEHADNTIHHRQQFCGGLTERWPISMAQYCMAIQDQTDGYRFRLSSSSCSVWLLICLLFLSSHATVCRAARRRRCGNWACCMNDVCVFVWVNEGIESSMLGQQSAHHHFDLTTTATNLNITHSFWNDMMFFSTNYAPTRWCYEETILNDVNSYGQRAVAADREREKAKERHTWRAPKQYDRPKKLIMNDIKHIIFIAVYMLFSSSFLFEQPARRLDADFHANSEYVERSRALALADWLWSGIEFMGMGIGYSMIRRPAAGRWARYNDILSY